MQTLRAEETLEIACFMADFLVLLKHDDAVFYLKGPCLKTLTRQDIGQSTIELSVKYCSSVCGQ